MAVYLIAQVDIHDMDVFMDYQNKAKQTIENAGGKMLVRNAVPEAVEGLAEVFARGGKPEGPTETEMKELHAKIGRLAVENDFLSQGLKR